MPNYSECIVALKVSKHCQEYKVYAVSMWLLCILLSAVDIQWLGVHCSDLFDSDGHPIVPMSSFQEWTASDERVFSGIWDVVQGLVSKLFQWILSILNCTLFVFFYSLSQSQPQYVRELEEMRRKRLKAEIEVINCSNFDTLENKIIQKILRKQFF